MYPGVPFEQDGLTCVWRERVFFNPLLGPMYQTHRVFELYVESPIRFDGDLAAVAWRRGID